MCVDYIRSVLCCGLRSRLVPRLVVCVSVRDRLFFFKFPLFESLVFGFIVCWLEGTSTCR